MKKAFSGILTAVFILGIVSFLKTDAIPDRKGSKNTARIECEKQCITNMQKCLILANRFNNYRKRNLSIQLCNTEKNKCMLTCSKIKDEAEKKMHEGKRIDPKAERRERERIERERRERERIDRENRERERIERENRERERIERENRERERIKREKREHRSRKCEKRCKREQSNCFENAERFNNERVKKLVMNICRDEKERCKRECLDRFD